MTTTETRLPSVIAGALFALATAHSIADAALLCQKKNGVIVVRPTACARKEAPLDLSRFGAAGPVGPPGAAGRDFTVDTTLPSGATQVGTFAGSLSLDGSPVGATEIVIPITLRIPLAAPIPEGNTIRVTGVDGTALHCPGLNRADPGYFCLYETTNYGNASFTEFGNPVERIAGLGRFGGYLAYNAVSRRTHIIGTWAVTAP